MIEASVDNGRTANIIVMGMSKVAGVRDENGSLEVAYLGRAPTKFPSPVMVDGVEMSAISSKGRAAKGFAVLVVVPA